MSIMLKPLSAACALMLALNLSSAEPAHASRAEVPEAESTALSLKSWQDDRFGMFIHWGIYSKYAGEYKDSKRKFTEHIQLQAKIPVAEYEQMAATFNPTEFDAEEWVLAAKNAGMKYLVITTKHHDGFAMYDSKCSGYNICKATPFGRDAVGELERACRRHGLKFGVYYSLGRDWADPDTPSSWPTKGARSNTWDFPDEDSKDYSKYISRKVVPQLQELLTAYNPDIVWFDTPEGTTPEQSIELRKIIKSHNPATLINQRIGNGKGDFRILEQEQSDSILPFPWEACITMSRNWGYIKRDRDFKHPSKIIDILTDVVSKGGNLLLNVGPTDTGIIRPENLEQMKAIGKWMQRYGHAVVGSHPWIVYGEDPQADGATMEKAPFDDTEYDATKEQKQDIRFTAKNDKEIFLIARNWAEPTVVCRALASTSHKIDSIELPGYGNVIKWKQSPEGLTISLPEGAVDSEMPIYVFNVKLK